MSFVQTLRSPRVWMAFFLAMGLFASAYLLYVYVTGGPIACGPAHGCDVVRASRWAYVGPIPQPLLGVLFYSGMLGILIARSVLDGSTNASSWLWRLTRVGAVVGFIESVALFLIQWLEIGAFCTWCLVSGVAATMVFLLAWADRGSQGGEAQLADLRGYACVMGLLAVLGVPGFLFLVRPALLGL